MDVKSLLIFSRIEQIFFSVKGFLLELPKNKLKLFQNSSQRHRPPNYGHIRLGQPADQNQRDQVGGAGDANLNQKIHITSPPQSDPHNGSSQGRPPDHIEPGHGTEILAYQQVKGNEQRPLGEDGGNGGSAIAVNGDKNQVGDNVEQHADDKSAGQVALLVDSDQDILGDLVDEAEGQKPDEQLQHNHGIGQETLAGQEQD